MSINRWIKKLWYIYTMDNYSAIKSNAFEPIAFISRANKVILKILQARL